MEQIYEMLRDQLKDAASAEKQAIQGMRRTLRKASDPALREGIEAHIAQSELQRERAEQALQALGAKPGRKLCEAMRGLVEEAQQEQEEHDKGPILDLVIVAALQRIEHYEIAAYGTMAELANALEESEVAGLLAETLAEEKAQDARLTEVTRSSVLPAALEEGEEVEIEDAPAPLPTRRGTARKAPAKPAAGGRKPAAGPRKPSAKPGGTGKAPARRRG
jgi:ferritin-like metal-binding protein YciE